MTLKPYTTYLYKDEDNYYVAKAKNGQILDANNDAPELILKQGLDRAGVLEIHGNFLCSSGLAAQGGLNLKSNTHIVVGPDTTIQVPQGYTGDLFVFDWNYQNSTIYNVSIEGLLNVTEQGTPEYNWDAVAFNLQNPGSPSSSGICMVDFGHLNVRNAKSALNLNLLHSGGWITSCNFEKMRIWTSRRAIEFENTAGVTIVPGISSNTFNHIWQQSSSVLDYGVKDVLGRNLTFKDVAIWDLQYSYDDEDVDTDLGDGHSASFSPYCKDIFVEAGIMMYYNMINNAPKGTVRWLDAHSSDSVWQYYEENTVFSDVGNGIKVAFTIPHGMGFTPKRMDVIPASDDAWISPIKWTWDSTNIYVTFQGTPPPPATAGNPSNVKFRWRSTTK